MTDNSVAAATRRGFVGTLAQLLELCLSLGAHDNDQNDITSRMPKRYILLSLFPLALHAADPLVGTWKLSPDGKSIEADTSMKLPNRKMMVDNEDTAKQ